MRLLDLFCGRVGGCSIGYARAGFDVTGVDLAASPAYPFAFVQADALAILQDVDYLRTFDVIHASPPCQELTRARHLRDAQGGKVKAHGVNLIPPVRAGLLAAGVPYVIENVDDARSHLVDPVRLCGSAFGLGVRRHRWFESSAYLFGVECDHAGQGRPVGVYGRPGDQIPEGGRTAGDVDLGAVAMGVPGWGSELRKTARWDAIKESVPPAFTEYLGEQLAEKIRREKISR